MSLCTVLLLSLSVAAVTGYGQYRAAIPNGDHVPHPCKANYVWHGVGHLNAQGGGDRNPFGLDFAKQGHRWTRELCAMDSDGDGETNGQELGDPQCVWTAGTPPPRDTGITHPGVCDPYDSPKCAAQNSWVDCSTDLDFSCDYINTPDVRNMTVRFPRTKVPAKETTYICFNFALPDDQQYHVIATEALIDNVNVMHHMVVNRCEQGAKPQTTDAVECGMGVEGCEDIMSLWTVGIAGECFNPQAGFLIGKGASTYLSVQHHWTNPSEVDEWYDTSGLIIYYTPKLRENNMATLTIGQSYLEIPPGLPAVTHSGACTAECTRKTFNGPIHVVTALNHMHYMGIRQNVTLSQPGHAIKTLTNDNPYSYDSPKPVFFDEPITVNPGDELKTYCTYQSMSKSETTYFGQGSFEEMCFAFLTFFPAESAESLSCNQHGDLDECFSYIPQPGDGPDQCVMEAILNSTMPDTAALVWPVLEACDLTGKCRDGCPEAISVAKRHPCVRDSWSVVVAYFTAMFDPVLLKFVTAMQSCDMKHDGEETHHTTPKPSMPHGHEQPMQSPETLFMSLIKGMDAKPLLQNIVMNINYNNVNNDDKDHAETWH